MSSDDNDIEQRIKNFLGLTGTGTGGTVLANLVKSLLNRPTQGGDLIKRIPTSLRRRCTIAEIWISPIEASKGRCVYFPLKQYEEVIFLPAGVQEGSNFFYSQRGLPLKQDSYERSDLLVIVHVVSNPALFRP